MSLFLSVSPHLVAPNFAAQLASKPCLHLPMPSPRPEPGPLVQQEATKPAGTFSLLTNAPPHSFHSRNFSPRATCRPPHQATIPSFHIFRAPRSQSSSSRFPTPSLSCATAHQSSRCCNAALKHCQSSARRQFQRICGVDEEDATRRPHQSL